MTQLDRLVRLARKGTSLEDLCNRMDLSPRRVSYLLKEAKAEGMAVELVGGVVALHPSGPAADVARVSMDVASAEHPHRFAVISDLHFGSKYHLRDQLKDFIHLAYKKGCRNIFIPGDLTDGCYRHGRWELTHHGFQDQAEDFIKGLPEHRGLHYTAITGNHDQTFEDSSGIVVHKALEDMFRSAGRRDVDILGARGAYVRLRAKGERRGLLVELWHPFKGPAYALSYKLQKKVEGYSVGMKPDAVFTGHWHQQCYCVVRGVHAFSSGTFQGGGSAFGKALGGSPSIGGWIIEYALTKDGTVRELTPTWVSYYERETAREVSI
jgi:hypothetical protein